MRETEGAVEQPIPQLAPAPGSDAGQEEAEIAPSRVAAWVRNYPVLAGGLALIAAEVLWKAQFLSHLYFRQDDYVNQAIALKSPLDLRYLFLVGDGHLFPGLRAITWVLVRISLYNWGLDAGVALAFTAAASLAALRLLRTLFGDRRAILIPLAIYALTPLTVPDLGWWWCAMESLPLQLAIFMMLNAHVGYVRTRRGRHLVAACLWLVFGLPFFEKAMLLAPLLFAATAAFLTQSRSWLAGALLTLRRHWRAWLAYGLIMIGYLVMFSAALRGSAQQPHVPPAAAAFTFGWVMIKETLLTGAIGGPLRWLPFGDRLYAIAVPASSVLWLSWLTALAVLWVSVMTRARAWRAWVILAGWIICADMVPVFLGRMVPGIGNYYAGLLALETRYLADAACVLAICAGLAFLPVVGVPQAERAAGQRQIVLSSQGRRFAFSADQGARYAALALVAIFVIGSIRSVQAYENVTNGGPAARSYIANAGQAVRLAPHGTNVLDQYMPRLTVGPSFGRDSLESFVLGAAARGPAAANLHWITSTSGTVDNLKMFGANGKLYPAQVSGVYSVHRPGSGFGGCWPERGGQIVVRLQQATSSADVMLHFAYVWGSQAATVAVRYGTEVQALAVLPGVHSAYLPVHGDVSDFVVSGLGSIRMCIGSDTASGWLVPYGTPIP